MTPAALVALVAVDVVVTLGVQQFVIQLFGIIHGGPGLALPAIMA